MALDRANKAHWMLSGAASGAFSPIKETLSAPDIKNDTSEDSVQVR